MIEQTHVTLLQLDILLENSDFSVAEIVKAYNAAVNACGNKDISPEDLNERRIKLGLLLEARLIRLKEENKLDELNIEEVEELIVLLRAFAICRYGISLIMSEANFSFIPEKVLVIIKKQLSDFITSKHITDLKTLLDMLGNYKNLLLTES